MSGKVIEVNTSSQFSTYIRKSGLTVVDFYATWCGPCMQAKPAYERLASKYTNTVFLKVDVDKAGDISQQEGVKAMPTFKFYKNGSKIAEVVGADIGKVESYVKQYGTTTSSSFSSGGRVLGHEPGYGSNNNASVSSSRSGSSAFSLSDMIKSKIDQIPPNQRLGYVVAFVVAVYILLRLVFSLI
ncbi:hypothetical protein ABK040_009768 [Willaertia magna]